MTFDFYHGHRPSLVGVTRKEDIEGAVSEGWRRDWGVTPTLRWYEDGPVLQIRNVDPSGCTSWFVVGCVRELMPQPRY